MSKTNTKRTWCLIMALMIAFCCFMTKPEPVEAATTSSHWIINRYDGGNNYSGKYIIYRDWGKFSAGLFGKKFTIQEVNYLSQLSSSEKWYFDKYARFGVYVYKTNGNLYKYYGGLKNGSSFKIPKGTYSITIRSEIDSSGWSQFSKYAGKWTYAQYRLKY